MTDVSMTQPGLPEADNPVFDDIRRVSVPAARVARLQTDWVKIITPLVQQLKLAVRMNTKSRCIELKMTSETQDPSQMSKAVDYLTAYMLGFYLKDCVALLRLSDLFIESFQIQDVKTLKGANMSRCIGRIAGKDGKTKHAIENTTRTRIVMDDERIHILGAFESIRVARNAVCALILGSPPNKIYNKLKNAKHYLNSR